MTPDGTGTASASALSFAPRRHQRRTSEWGRALNTNPGYVIDNTADLQLNAPLAQATSCRTTCECPSVPVELSPRQTQFSCHVRAFSLPAALTPGTDRWIEVKTWLTGSNDMPQLAVATQRLCTIDPGHARAIIRGRLDQTTDPLPNGILALGLLLAEDDESVDRNVMSRDPRNLPLRRCLETNNFKPQSDFGVRFIDDEHGVSDPTNDRRRPNYYPLLHP